MRQVRAAAAVHSAVHVRRRAAAGPAGEGAQVNRLDLFFLTLINLGLGLGAFYIVLELGWEAGIGYGAVVCVGAGVIGGMRR